MGVTMTTVTRYQVTLVPLVTMCLMTPMVSAGSAYWWMGESGSFGGGGNDNGVGYGQQTHSQPQQIHNQPNVPHNSAGSNNVITSNNINAPNSGYELPATECAVGFKCVSEMFCDQTGTMVEYRVDLTQQQKKQRGQLVPCMNQALGIFQVCCRKPASFDSPRNPQQQQQSQPQQQPQQQFQQQQPQQQFQQQQQQCPAVTSLPAVSSCAVKKSNCWSVGQTDVDCLDNALCCFDGCANVCQGRGPIAGNPGPSQNPVRQPTVVVAPQTPAQVPVQAPPLPVTQPVYQPQNQGQQYPVQNLPQKPKKQNKKPAKVFSPQPQQQQPSSSADQQPFIQCPSAMKCVPKINCDFNGVMVNYEVRLNRVQEEGRVPLIPCFNQRGNTVDVCCRDPNYKDPWPDMNNGNGNGNFNGNNGNNNNNRKKNHNNNKQNKRQQQKQLQVSNGNIRNGYGK